jgi:hypothetical protein
VVRSMSACLSWSDVVRVMGLNQCIPLLAHAQTRRCTTPPIPKSVEVGVPG